MLAKSLIIFLLVGICGVSAFSEQGFNNTHGDLSGFHFELLLTHLNALEERIATTLDEISHNNSELVELLKSSAKNCVTAWQTNANLKSTVVNSVVAELYNVYLNDLVKTGTTVEGSSLNEWIVFQARFDGSVDFYRSWKAYREGFGDTQNEHWLGLNKLHKMLSQQPHELLITMENFENEIKYAHYDAFVIGNEDAKFEIKTLGKYTGTAGDSLRYHVGSMFTTYDQQNDVNTSNCAKLYRGAWWFKDCYASHLNGEYTTKKQTLEKGLIWVSFTGPFSSLKSSVMMVRPRVV
ncbi:fibrinogen C domain-containing protein 1-like [Anopheles nili]|uniref:fibrinogen C domain-containing protein 1-like n=1 Tax=Anopheles nili TaxID=185578 RepID=UPI00237C1C04|nr:fibrinogen C domain-containing protein 1-like [Anopheles nili]